MFKMTTFCGKNLLYTGSMTLKFAAVEPAGKPKSENVPKVALFLAVMLLIMAVLQLFSFEKFIPLIESFGLPGGDGTAALVAGLLVVAEVFALPFLLRMRLSPLMRVFSMVCSWVAVAGWVKLAVWVNIMRPEADNLGLLGTSIDLPAGWWAVFFMVALGILAAWASWGMWPLKKSLRK